MKKQIFRGISAVLALVVTLALAAPAVRAARSAAAQTGEGEFFIISSVDVAKRKLVLKLPTEVTLSMEVNDKTVILGEKGERLKINQLQAGDTAYITYAKNPQGDIAEKIQLGPMTVQELHRRYLKGYAVPVPTPPPPPAKSTSPKTAVPHRVPAHLQRGS